MEAQKLCARETGWCYIASLPDVHVSLLLRRQDLEARLSQLAAKLAALRSSFALIQDMVDLPGLSVWHAELSRVISANLAAEMSR